MRRLILTLFMLMLLAGCGPVETLTPTQTEPKAIVPTARTATGPAPTSAPFPTQTLTPSQNPILVTPFPPPSGDAGPVPLGALTRLGLGSIQYTALSHQGDFLAVGTTVGVYVYRTSNFKQIWKRFTFGPISKLLWSPDDRMIASLIIGDPATRVFESASGAEIAVFEHTTGGYDAAWSPDGANLVIAWGGFDIGGRLTIWNVASQESIRTIQVEPDAPDRFHPAIYTVAWLPDGNRIAATTEIITKNGRSQPSLLLWDLSAGNLLVADPITASVNRGFLQYLTPSPDGNWIAAYTGLTNSDAPGGSNSVFVWDTRTAQIPHLYAVMGPAVFAAAWSSDSTLLAAATGDMGPNIGNGTVAIWNVQSGSDIHELAGHIGGVYSLGWSPDNSTLISGGGDYEHGGMLIGWDASSGDQRFAVAGWPMSVEHIHWMPDGSSVFVTSGDRVQQFDSQSHALRQTLVASYGLRGVSDVVWSPDGKHIAAEIGGFDNESAVAVWDAQTMLPVYTIPVPVFDLAWSPDGTILRSRTGDPDRSPASQYWDSMTGQKLDTSKWVASYGDGYTGALTQSPDGTLLVEPVSLMPESVIIKTIKVVDAATHWVVVELGGFAAGVRSVAWAPDGRFLAAGGGFTPGHGSPFVEGWDENKIIVWDTATWLPVYQFVGHTGRVESLSWSPDSRLLASGSADGTVIVWAVVQ